MEDAYPTEGANRPGAFPQTRWTRVLALQATDPEQSRKALEDLCEIYWLPIYSYYRRSGRNSEDAKDLTQSLFEQMIRRGDFAKADEEKGKMRSFLLTMAKRHLVAKIRHDTTERRGGSNYTLSLDVESAELLHAVQSLSDLSPDKMFDRQWAAVTLEQARTSLAKEYAGRGRKQQYEVLRSYLSWNENPDVPYAEASQRAGLTEQAFRAAVSRMRKRFQALLRDQIADTVLEGDDVDIEIRYLFTALS
jgi:RNA polymerase sigma-70 factor (ECF subfamily)